MRRSFRIALVALAALPAAGLAQAPATSPALAATPALAPEDARLYAFLDAEFADELKFRPQLATQIGLKEGNDQLDDNSDAAALRRLQRQRDSVARMKARFDRAKLSTDAQVNYDIYALELDRAELAYANRRYAPPFYSFLYSVNTGLPNFLINTHNVSDAQDMRAYAARVRAMPRVLDEAIAQSRRSDAAGIRAPRFQIERIITGSRQIVTGAPFEGGAPSPLWADAQAKVAKLKAANKVTPAEADALLADTRAALVTIKPAYDRVIAWAQGDLATAPSGRVGAISLPGGGAWYAAALKLNTTTDLTADQIHRTGLSEVKRIEGEQDALARTAGFKDRIAWYADYASKHPPVPWTDALRAKYLADANAQLAKNRTLLPPLFGELPKYNMEVLREPSFSEVAGGAAHAAGASRDGARPGRVWVHLLGTTENTPPAAMVDLMCHEGVPGHVMQGDIQVRQSVGPRFRQTARYVAFSEGWGLIPSCCARRWAPIPTPPAT